MFPQHYVGTKYTMKQEQLIKSSQVRAISNLFFYKNRHSFIRVTCTNVILLKDSYLKEGVILWEGFCPPAQKQPLLLYIWLNTDFFQSINCGSNFILCLPFLFDWQIPKCLPLHLVYTYDLKLSTQVQKILLHLEYMTLVNIKTLLECKQSIFILKSSNFIIS